MVPNGDGVEVITSDREFTLLYKNLQLKMVTKNGQQLLIDRQRVTLTNTYETDDCYR